MGKSRDNDSTNNPSKTSGMLFPTSERQARAAAVTAVAEIRACHTLWQGMAVQIEARVMDACRRIRDVYADRDAFSEFVGYELAGVLDANLAWQMANLWEAARHDHRVAGLVVEAPETALALVSGFTLARTKDGRTLAAADLDEHEQEFNKLLALSPKDRKKKLRQMNDERRAALDGHNPEDVARIEQMEAEKAARTEAVAEKPVNLAQQRKAAADKVLASVHALCDAANEVRDLGRRGVYSAHLCERLDLCRNMLERAVVALQETVAHANEQERTS